jgi:hypothetical protein
VPRGHLTRHPPGTSGCRRELAGARAARRRGRSGPLSPRMKDRELILRFAAFYYEPHKYTRPMKEFLNGFMPRHRNLQGLDADELRRLFHDSLVILSQSIRPTELFRPVSAINAAVFDSVMVGIARRVAAGEIADATLVETHYRELLREEEFRQVLASRPQ